MVKIDYCPSCGEKLSEDSFICPKCHLDVGELFEKDYLNMDNDEDNSIELFDGSLESEIIDAQEISISDGDEIVIVVPQDGSEDEIVIDLDALGIDVEELGDEVNIVIQVEGEADESSELLDDEIIEPNQWFFDDDPYGIVYYEFVDDED